MSETCTCGDVLDEHEPGGGACLECPCIAYEDDGEGE